MSFCEKHKQTAAQKSEKNSIFFFSGAKLDNQYFYFLLMSFLDIKPH